MSGIGNRESGIGEPRTEKPGLVARMDVTAEVSSQRPRIAIAGTLDETR
jgi:hypothetical protein